MKIGVGGENPLKAKAVKNLTALYPLWHGAEVASKQVSSGVADQPMSLEETIRGARNRARAASEGCDYGVGIESGLMDVPYAESGMMNICACAIYDGRHYALGLSSAFEFPREITRLVRSEGMSVREAALAVGFTDRPNIAHEEGNIGLLTKGRLTRTAYTMQAVSMALIELENSAWYRRRIVCTVCSREKAEGLLPARELYQGSHIRQVEAEARRLGREFYILSGVYGLIPAGQLIKSYDHALAPDEVKPLARRVAEQLASDPPDEVHLYSKLKEAWAPYIEALRVAAIAKGVGLHLHELADND